MTNNKEQNKKLLPDEYIKNIRIAPVGLAVVLIASVLFIVGIMTWMNYGTVADIKDFVGFRTSEDSQSIVVYVSHNDEAHEYGLNSSVLVDGKTGYHIQETSSRHFSADEVLASVDSEYIKNLLDLADWNEKIVIVPDEGNEFDENNETFKVSIMMGNKQLQEYLPWGR